MDTTTTSYIAQRNSCDPCEEPCAEDGSSSNSRDCDCHDNSRPTREDAMEAVRTILRFIGDEPGRSGLKETPKRFVDSLCECFEGYDIDESVVLLKTFDEIDKYDDLIVLKNIPFSSYCEHHIAPFVGVASVAYWPDCRAVGLSKLARVVDVFARRLQTQENMTTQIAHAIYTHLQPKGVAVMIEAEHYCMRMRGVRKPNMLTKTYCFLGNFLEDDSLKDRFRGCVE